LFEYHFFRRNLCVLKKVNFFCKITKLSIKHSTLRWNTRSITKTYWANHSMDSKCYIIARRCCSTCFCQNTTFFARKFKVSTCYLSRSKVFRLSEKNGLLRFFKCQRWLLANRPVIVTVNQLRMILVKVMNFNIIDSGV